MAESILYSRKNPDDVFNRVVIAGLLDLLNHKVHYDQIWQDNIVEDVCVPFVYAFPQDWNERFAQDFYTFFGRECFSDKLIDGKFDMIPRGALKYTGCNIDAANITNRFVRGTYLKDENGKLTSYTAFMYSIPLTFNFECEVWVDNIDTAFKIEQALREAFYKNKSYNVLYKGMKIACCAGFPETVTGEKTIQYAFDSERQMKLTFSIVVEAYQPCFDQSTEIESSRRIENFALDVNHYVDGGIGPADRVVEGSFEGVSNLYPWPSGETMQIRWKTRSNTSDVCTVLLAYTDADGGRHVIATPFFNKGEYLWNIPSDISGYRQPSMSYIETDSCRVIEEPKVKIIPNSAGRIDELSFTIYDAGKFTAHSNAILDVVLEYVGDDGNVVMSSSYSANIVNGQLAEILLNGKAMKYDKEYKKAKISLSLEYPIDGTVLDKIDNIVII